jgi:hypothetical protein
VRWAFLGEKYSDPTAFLQAYKFNPRMLRNPAYNASIGLDIKCPGAAASGADLCFIRPDRSSNDSRYQDADEIVMKSLVKETGSLGLGSFKKYSDELDFLLKMAEDYVKYIVSDSSRLSRFYMVLEVAGSNWVIMNNAMDGLRLQSMYDLKGSTSKRTANAGDQCEGKFKDNDWNAAGMKIFLPAFTRGKVLEAITRDAQFLRSKNIMDHSLLVSHDSVPVYCTPQGIEMDADGRGGRCVSAKHQPHDLAEPVDLRFGLTDMFYPEIPLSTPGQRVHCCPNIPEHGEALNGPIGSYIEKYSMIAGNLRRNDIRFQHSKQRMEDLESAEVEKLKRLKAVSEVDSNVSCPH